MTSPRFAELHMHLEGSLEPDMMFDLARRNRMEIPFKSVEEVRAAYAFSNLQDFLDIYYQGAQVLQTAEDFHDLTLAYLDRAAADGVVHVELFFDPQTHTDRGIPFAVVMEGLLAGLSRGRLRHGISGGLILCLLRHLDEAAGLATLKQAEPWFDKLLGIGLDSSEVGHPPVKFQRCFEIAGEAGLKRVAHACEEGPPEYVWQALDVLKVDRIDHGNRALEDPRLIERIVKEQIALTVCPLSNLSLCVVKAMADHPLQKMLDLGIKATINSDDPAYFGGYLGANIAAVRDHLGMGEGAIAHLARNSIEASFLPPAEKARILA
ncbi:MAG: adenosine deaminase [Caulobacterales bacterium]